MTVPLDVGSSTGCPVTSPDSVCDGVTLPDLQGESSVAPPRLPPPLGTVTPRQPMPRETFEPVCACLCPSVPEACKAAPFVHHPDRGSARRNGGDTSPSCHLSASVGDPRKSHPAEPSQTTIKRQIQTELPPRGASASRLHLGCQSARRPARPAAAWAVGKVPGEQA